MKEKINRAQQIADWVVNTSILEKLKKADPSKPFKVLIGPTEAMDVLTINLDGNRNLREAHIQFLRSEMETDNWVSTSQNTMGITKDFALIDGQHRLWAVALSGKPQTFYFMLGLEDKAIAYTDLNQTRNGGDIAKVNGYGDHAGALSYAIKNIILYKETGKMLGGVNFKTVTNHAINTFMQDEKVMKRLVDDLLYIKANWMVSAGKFFQPAQWLTIYYILYSLPGMSKKAKEFMDSFASGANLSSKSPIYKIRIYFGNELSHLAKGKNKNRINKNHLTFKVKYVFAAWELMLKGWKGDGDITIDTDSLEIPKPYFTKA